MVRWLLSLYYMLSFYGHLIMFFILASILITVAFIGMLLSFIFAILETFFLGVSGKFSGEELHSRSSNLYGGIKKMTSTDNTEA